MWGSGFGLMGGGAIWMIVFWVLIIGVAIWALRLLFDGTQPRQSTSPTRSPEEIAKTRYARGEISQQEYLALLDMLEEGER